MGVGGDFSSSLRVLVPVQKDSFVIFTCRGKNVAENQTNLAEKKKSCIQEIIKTVEGTDHNEFVIAKKGEFCSYDYNIFGFFPDLFLLTNLVFFRVFFITKK